MLAATFLGDSSATAMTNDGNRFAVFLLMLLLKDLPVWNIAFGSGWPQKRRSRIDAELTVMRRAILGRLQFHLP